MKILCFGIVFLPLLISLGSWQLKRAEEKQGLMLLHEQQSDLPPGNWKTLLAEPVRYQSLLLGGSFVQDNDWLLDNQINQGQTGYRVFTPFCQGIQCILVDRGWVEGDVNREKLPAIDRIKGEVMVAGKIDKISANPAVGENEPLLSSPYRVQQIELELIESKMPLEPLGSDINKEDHEDARKQLLLYDWVLRLDVQQPGSFQVLWKPVILGPEKHFGYAFQWFAMAFALLILLLYTGFKSLSKKTAG